MRPPSPRVRIEIKGKDEFWARAFHVEWEDGFPQRRLLRDASGYFEADEDWLEDLRQVAARSFCNVVIAPDNPERRSWFRSLLPR